MSTTFRSIWRQYSESYYPEIIVNDAHPRTTVPVILAALAVVLLMYFIPSARRFSGFNHPFLPVALFACAFAFTSWQWVVWQQATKRNILMLFDSSLYCLAVLSITLDTTSPTRYVWCLLYAQMVAHLGNRYAFNWPIFFSVCVIPSAVVIVLGHSDPAIIALAVFGTMMFVVNGTNTRHAMNVRKEKERYKAAFELADKVASESLDIALVATMAEVGTFLHEIKNSLTPITANTMLLKEDENLSEDNKEVVQDLETSGNRCNDLIEKLFTSITRRASASPTKFLLQDALLLESLCQGLPPGDRRKIALMGTVPSFEISGNSEHLLAAITNLVSNALQARARHVEIAASHDGGLRSVIVSIKDDGPGIPLPSRENLFVPLKGSSKGPGHGLGLPLSRRLVDVLGGKLFLKETGADGTTFEIVLPGRHIPTSDAPPPGSPAEA